MKGAAKYGWITRFAGAVLVSLLALPSHAQLMLAHEGHHGAGGCTIDTGDFPVTFSAYEVPEGDLPPMHSYCDRIPNTGKVNLTIELTDRKSREIPFAVRLVKEGHDEHGDRAHSDAAAENKEESDEIDHDGHDEMDHDVAEQEGHKDPWHGSGEHGDWYMAPMVHNSGIIVIATKIMEEGQYAILLEKEDDADVVTTAVRIPLYVGGGGGHGGHGGGFGMMEIALLLVVAGGGAFYYMRRKKAGEAEEKS